MNNFIPVKLGYDPETGLNAPTPLGFEISSMRYKDGEYVPGYAKPHKEDVIRKFLDDMQESANEYKRVKAVAGPKATKEDLLNLYTIADYHLGMLCWGRETGDNWNLNLAIEMLLKGFVDMMNRAPAASECFINQLGDFLHTDSIVPVTPAGHHVLDADTRYYKLAETGLYLMRQMIDLALKRHDKVTVLCAEGNHDTSSAPWLQIALGAIYEKEPRVDIMMEPKPYYAHKFGSSMLCFHHGHKRAKPDDLRKIFSSDPQFRPTWGECKYAYCHTGHLHHERVEDGGMICIQHPTLAGRSAYETRGGWSSQRACISFTYSKTYGEMYSAYTRPEMLDMETT